MAQTHHQATGYIGASLRRVEDGRFLRGQGQFATDIRIPGMAHAAVLRSPHGHARLLSIDLSDALQAEGVIAAWSASDLGSANAEIPVAMPHPRLRGVGARPLALNRVRYVGEPVAVVIAESRYLAEDALERIVVEYEPLPAATTVHEALDDGAPVLHEQLGTNVALEMHHEHGDVEAAFRDAELTVRGRFSLGRCNGAPMETRAVTAEYRPAPHGVSLTVWNSTQSPHSARRVLANLLGMPLHSIRMIAPDIGGGFGVKNRFYPEELLVPYAAKRLKRPVQWIEDRREDLLSTYQAREQEQEIEVAVKRDGTILGVKSRILHDTGAYTPFGVVVPWNSAEALAGPYLFPAARIDLLGVYTNKQGNAPYRGAGRPSGAFVGERYMDLVASELGLDPVDVRRRNIIPADAMPFSSGMVSREGGPIEYDSGDYPGTLEALVEAVDIPAFRKQQEAARKEGRYLGLGVVNYVERTGTGPFEGATVRVDPDGHVLVKTGATPQGQGHETVYAQVCAQRLGVRPEDVTVITGDTEAISLGIGTSASRSAVTAGNAVSQAAQGVKEKALRVAAQLLEASVEDMEMEEGVARVRGAPERSVSLNRVAQLTSSPPAGSIGGAPVEPGLEFTTYFSPESPTFSNGAHAAIVEVDPESGIVEIQRYVVAHDCGTVLNPMLLDGQVHGGVAQGLGNALTEELVYDADGQLLTASLMDYLVPSATEVPSMETVHLETPSPHNPEGIKGAGEGGTIPVPAVIASAIDDALGVRVTHAPTTPERLWRLVKERGTGS